MILLTLYQVGDQAHVAVPSGSHRDWILRLLANATIGVLNTVNTANGADDVLAPDGLPSKMPRTIDEPEQTPTPTGG